MAFPIRTHQRGVALIIALVMLSVVLIVTGVLLRSARQQEQVTAGSTSVSRAQFAAELALREAIRGLLAGTITRVDPASASALTWKFPLTATWTNSPEGDYSYTYTVSYRKMRDPVPGDTSTPRLLRDTIALTDRGVPIFQIDAEGRSGNARRRVEIAVSDVYNPMPFGWGLVGCEAVWLDSRAETRGFDSRFAGTYPAANPARKQDWLEAGNILVYGSQDLSGTKKKFTRGSVEIGSSGLVRGNIESKGSVNIKSATVTGYISALGSITIDPNSSVRAVWYDKDNPDVKYTAKSKMVFPFAGEAPSFDEPLCDDKNVKKLVDDKIGEVGAGVFSPASAFTSVPAEQARLFYSGGAMAPRGISSTNPLVLNLGSATTTNPNGTTYYLKSLNVGDDVVINVTGKVTLILGEACSNACGSNTTSGSFSMVSSKTRLNLSTGAQLVVYATGSVLFDKAGVNYLDNDAKPPALTIYTSVVNNEATIPDVSAAKVQLAAPNTTLRALLYAPLAYVRLKSNNAMYGSIRGKWIYLESNTAFTYDQAASAVDATPVGYRIAYWSERSYDSYGN